MVGSKPSVSFDEERLKEESLIAYKALFVLLVFFCLLLSKAFEEKHIFIHFW